MEPKNLKKHGKYIKMLHDAIKQALKQIITIIEEIQNLTETQQRYLYCDLNIGKHIRHINDHFLALQQGIDTGVVNYNSRNRGTKTESHSHVALSQLQQLLTWVDDCESKLSKADINKPIKIFSEIDCLQTQSMEFNSSIAREFLYLINHTIHHAAHIALIAKKHGVEIPFNTGIAPCTMTFLRASK